MIVILILALLLFGPKKLPELARALGKATGEYHRAAREFEKETEELKKTASEIEKEASTVNNIKNSLKEIGEKTKQN